jgi:hypothetical protein
MDPAAVRVEICKKYMDIVNQRESESLTSRPSIKSDLAVLWSTENMTSDELQNRYTGKGLLQCFVDCLYIIEMKHFMALKDGALKAKLQLLCESLARSILLKQNESQRNILFSILCDVGALHVLLHFPLEQKAFLSHRSIQPGQMVCVMAWLHMESKKGQNSSISSEDFMKKFELTIGNLYFDEWKDFGMETKQRRPDQSKNETNREEKSAKWQQHGGDDRTDKDHAFLVLDFDAMEKREEEERLARRMTTFSMLMNHFNHGDTILLTEEVLEEFERSQPPTRKRSYIGSE